MDATELRNVVGQNLKARRRELGLTQTQLAARVGVSQAYLSRIETGTRVADTDLLARLAEALETSPLALMSPDPIFSGRTLSAEEVAHR